MSTVKPPLTLPLMTPLTISSASWAAQVFPGLGALGFFAGELGFAVTIFDRIQSDMSRAIDRLEQALALVDPEDEPDVYTRVKDALMTFGGRSEVDANA